MIDLSPMKGIRIDPIRHTAQVQPGLRLGEFDRETQAFGLATTLGVNTDTGIAGLTLGGGYGRLNGKVRARLRQFAVCRRGDGRGPAGHRERHRKR
jgi:FAD/FMN-containing dehydrogenase